MAVPPPGPLDRSARQAERQRIARLSRLPPLYELSMRGSWQTAVAIAVQVALALALGLLVAKAVTGTSMPPGWIILYVMGAAFGLQFLARYLNAKAGRR